MKFAIVDIETTGGNAVHDRITEIAVYVHDGNKIIDEFCSLINPECNIPPFIQRLTGIDNEMVSHAPRFYEVAKDLVKITEGAVFVAHNAPFDYNFIRQEYKSLGFNFNRDYLCTVKLSRKLLPGFRSYSLGNLCNSLSIEIENRHRASGDALATVKLFEMLLAKSKDESNITNFVNNDYLNLRFPPGFDHAILNKLPETFGVYYLHDEHGNIIYIGKSNNIRKRILSHFRNKQSMKAIELRNSVRDISFEETGNELIALLLESEEIKKQQPFFNQAQKRIIANHCVAVKTNENGFMNLVVTRAKKDMENIVITAGSLDHANQVIERLIEKYNLCKKHCGGLNVSGPCFGYKIKQCFGACIGEESHIEYNKRVCRAVESLQFKDPNFMIIGNGRSASEKSIVHVEKGKYVGFGYFQPEFTIAQPDSLRDLVKFREDNRDVSRIIRSYLNNTKDPILSY